jgi:hypothetical protein
MRARTTLLTGLTLAGLVLTLAAAAPQPLTGGLPSLPQAAGPPFAAEHQIDMAGNDLSTGRAIVLRVRHTPDPQEPHRVSLEQTKVYVRRGDTGPIEVTARRHDGTVIDRWRAPDPLVTSAEQARDDEARYGVPYSPDLAIVEITDTRTGATTAAKTDEVVRLFCASSPTDEVCRRVDLVAHTSLEVPGPYVLTVGEPLDVPVHVRLENLGPDRADASAGMFVFGILDGVDFTTADPVSFDVAGFEPGVDERTVTYSLTCTQPGDVRVFVGARAFDGAPEAVEATPADNEFNSWFDVHCDPAA